MALYLTVGYAQCLNNNLMKLHKPVKVLLETQKLLLTFRKNLKNNSEKCEEVSDF